MWSEIELWYLEVSDLFTLVITKEVGWHTSWCVELLLLAVLPGYLEIGFLALPCSGALMFLP